ncbi:MAG: metal ABC transporter solute-binding protein, Zn/Mn family, partial [Cyanobium sp.]
VVLSGLRGWFVGVLAGLRPGWFVGVLSGLRPGWLRCVTAGMFRVGGQGRHAAAAVDQREGRGGRRAQHGHQHAAGPNPHIWLDPLRAAQQVENIRDGLIAADPACAEGYRRRAAAATAALRGLDAELASQLRPLRGRSFVVLHDFAPYFAQRYGLHAEFLVVSPEQAPSPSDLRRVSEVVRRSGLRVLLVPPGEASRVFDTLARDLGVRVAPFSPMEVLSAAELADPGTYLRLQRANAAALRSAFTP